MTFARAWLLCWLAIAAPWLVVALWDVRALRPGVFAVGVGVMGWAWFR